MDGKGTWSQWQVDNPHPEITLRTVFGKVWYEGYAKPEYVWQSTGGTDDFEAKFSLTPLIYGTLKGTFYALLFAVPLALLAWGWSAAPAGVLAAAFVVQYAGLLAERWFFFAQANHPQNLYYQAVA